MMFLSKDAISKQLFYEFLNFRLLNLAPGKPVELKPGTLLGSSLKEDLGISIEFAERQLRAQLINENLSPAVREQFSNLFTSLIAYKKSSYTSNNPFVHYAEADETVPFPSAWPVFAPLLINANGSSVSFDSKTSFITYLQAPKIGFQFKKDCPIEKTGLHLAVSTNNHEMVNAFLCPELYAYHLTKEDLKKLLSLTNDAKTRMALFHHCPQLISWLSSDKDLQVNCIHSFAELVELWAILNEEQRKEFIKSTHAQLWLKLLDPDLGRAKIEKLLAGNFSLLNVKLLQDISIKNNESLPQTLQFLTRKQHFNYLINANELNTLYPLPRKKDELLPLLSALGYQRSVDGKLTITRYILRGAVARVHHQLISVLISLPVKTQVIIEALEKVEQYIFHPQTQKEYKDFLSNIALEVVNKEYETGFFIITWINKLLRYLNIKSQSPLHPYLDKLTEMVQSEAVALIPGELMDILPAKADYSVYLSSLAAYFDANIELFWTNLPDQDQAKIIQDPIRFEGILTFLSTPADYRTNFYKALDSNSLNYFNTPQGLKQLIIDTPSFNAELDLPLLIEAMKTKGINFLDNVSSIVALLLDGNEKAFKQILPFFPVKTQTTDGLLFQESILEELPKPLQKAHFKRFLKAYCADANHFSALMLIIYNSNPLLVSQCWENVSYSIWVEWYGTLEHALDWSQILKHLELSDRLDFFEKLTSEGKLTADEFCDFLLEKNEALFLTLWSKIPAGQWATWLKDNPNLPATSLSLLNTMPYPLRVHFFKAMLKMSPLDLASVCVAPNITVEQFYLHEVTQKIATATTVSDARAKLSKLKETKRLDFDNGVVQLGKALEILNGYLKDISLVNIRSHKDWSPYLVSFFKTDPYYVLVNALRISKLSIDKLLTKILIHPLLAFDKLNQNSEIFIHLNQAVHEFDEHLAHLEEIAPEMPPNLMTEFTSLKSLSMRMKEIKRSIPQLEHGPRVLNFA